LSDGQRWFHWQARTSLNKEKNWTGKDGQQKCQCSKWIISNNVALFIHLAVYQKQ